MAKPVIVLAVLAAASAASGCAGFSRAIGAGKVAPDEFRVVTAAPLTLPPDYNLRPPRPGEPRPFETEPGAEARAALFGETVGQQSTAGERSLVTNAGAEAADANIRDTIDYESQGIVRRNETFANRVLSFGSEQAATAPLDAEAEARRIEEEEAIRRATGGGQVTIQRERGGFKLPGT